MIGRLVCLWGGCRRQDTGRPLREARRRFVEEDDRLRTVALDTINRSMPEIEPFPPDRLNDAILEVMRRTGPHRRRQPPSPGDVESLADDVLNLTDRP